MAKRGISTVCRGVRRDSPSAPPESGCDVGRKIPQAKPARDRSHLDHDSSTSHPPPATAGAAAAATAKKVGRAPRGACRESRRPQPCLLRICPESPPSAQNHSRNTFGLAISHDYLQKRVRLIAAVSSFFVAQRSRRTGSSRRI